MDPIFIIISGLTLSTAGKVLLGISVVRAHSHVAKEKKIDPDVIAQLKREKTVSFFGILLIIAGFVFEVIFYANVAAVF